jgi:hypothetical protein
MLLEVERIETGLPRRAGGIALADTSCGCRAIVAARSLPADETGTDHGQAISISLAFVVEPRFGTRRVLISMLMASAALLLLLCATLLGCGRAPEARVQEARAPNTRAPSGTLDQVQAAAFGLHFWVSASSIARPPGYGLRVHVEVHNPGDTAQVLPARPIVFSGVFGNLRADGSFEERGGGFAEEPLPLRGSLVVPAKGTVVVERDYPESYGRRLTSAGEAMQLSVAILPPLGRDQASTRKDLAEVLIGVSSSSAPPLVRISTEAP